MIDLLNIEGDEIHIDLTITFAKDEDNKSEILKGVPP
eukprot:CAMPEP_0117007722 /NCGR_PEP_ID=MMETSP0472-20121206/7503_1 /TAXON_ID=693140 ORGANISM="Tiarina fusus, Strain LIS" /NCGR_SAMPLE_ID=MMETSP0472 /ASSEMBLY_ACC=CAM_ASM_000603 /LENGTH=36 /DNA_ID= /DNA_START= /DNA_END= /DNA_ORIENTATION=